MSVYSYSFADAQRNFEVNPLSRWHAQPEKANGKILATARLGQVFKPGVEISRKINRDDTIFTIGSCFARELEQALARLGFTALSLKQTVTSVGAGYSNRYNTCSILNELRWAAGEPFPAGGLVEVRPGEFVDLHSHPVIGARSLDEVQSLRKALTEYFSQVYAANVVTITLGLIEGWYDKEQQSFINFAPIFGYSNRHFLKSDRFEFRVMSYEENMAALEAIYALLEARNPSANIFVTVSPVSLGATFSERDVVVANCFSKAMLRTCAETWKQMHPDRIQYFPSYEMATLSDRSIVYAEDGAHIKRKFVDQIMTHFTEVALAEASR